MTERPLGLSSEQFVHLHVYSEFSLLDGLSREGEMTRRVAGQGMTAMALRDHGAMYGVIPFYAAAKTAGPTSRSRWVRSTIDFSEGRWETALYLTASETEVEPAEAIVATIDARSGVVLEVDLEERTPPGS